MFKQVKNTYQEEKTIVLQKYVNKGTSVVKPHISMTIQWSVFLEQSEFRQKADTYETHF